VKGMLFICVICAKICVNLREQKNMISLVATSMAAVLFPQIDADFCADFRRLVAALFDECKQ
jgi:hypothetical protein